MAGNDGGGCQLSNDVSYTACPEGYPPQNTVLATIGKKLNDFPEIKGLLGSGFSKKEVAGRVLGMNPAGLCVVRWSTGNKHVDLTMTRRKLRNLVSANAPSEIASKKRTLSVVMENESAGESSESSESSQDSNGDDGEQLEPDETAASSDDTAFLLEPHGRKYFTSQLDDSTCQRQSSGKPRGKPSLLGMAMASETIDLTPLHYFELMFPKLLVSSISILTVSAIGIHSACRMSPKSSGNLVE
jgi:hypothetical protein